MGLSWRFLMGVLVYTVCTFAMALVWHLVLFEDRYRAFGYFEGEPNIGLGFVTILIQGVVLTFLFPRVSLGGLGIGRGLRFAAVVGVFFWTLHVLAFVAKQSVPEAGMFVAMESFYAALQMGLFGVLIALIYPMALAENGQQGGNDAK